MQRKFDEKNMKIQYRTRVPQYYSYKAPKTSVAGRSEHKQECCPLLASSAHVNLWQLIAKKNAYFQCNKMFVFAKFRNSYFFEVLCTENKE